MARTIPVVISANVPLALAQPVHSALDYPRALPGSTIDWAKVMDDTTNVVLFTPLSQAPDGGLAQRIFAVVAPFATVQDSISFEDLKARWAGGSTPLLVTEEAAVALGPVFESLPGQIVPAAELASRLAQQPGALGILPFDQLDPSYKVLAIDGANPLSNQFQPSHYPLAVALTVTGPDTKILAPIVQQSLPATNRDPSHLTQLIMTGVTAMSRGTAEKMEQKGYTYPALVISDTLRAADITHVSNEVPFIKGCRVNNTYMNLVLCSDYPYWQALEAIGTDIVGLSGNHVNDYGYDGARESIQFYRDHHIPIYGSGLNEEEACAPLMWEDHGNTFAFIAALAYYPESAWATTDKPGACYFYTNKDRILQMVQDLSQKVNIVAVELQYYETYEPAPTPEQVAEFRELRAAGADIVTGVQSHVPQALETYGTSETGGPGAVVYGLGNLFFDQMQAWDTRTGLIIRHTLYEGRPLSTEILTTVLEDFAQPRWATPKERKEILQRIFDAAPARPPVARASAASARTAVVSIPRGAAAAVSSVQTVQTGNSTEPGQGAQGEATPLQPPISAPATGVTTTVSNTAVVTLPEAQLPWPTPAPGATDHYWLSLPIAAGGMQMASPVYAFGDTLNGRYRPHHGVDIANPLGTSVLAPGAATIVFAGRDETPNIYGPYPDFFGNTLVFRLDRVWQDQPVYVVFGHLNEILVQTNDHVEAGQPVGTVGMTGIAIGPHLHVEVRLAAPGYGNSYNPGLWLEPLLGLGTVAGQLVTSDGRAWTGVNVLLYRLEEDGSQLYQVMPTYAADTSLRPDPERAENFLLAGVPAGEYELVFELQNQIYRGRLTVAPGATSFQRFVVS